MSVTVSGVARSTRKPGFYGEINTRAAKLGLPSSTAKLLILATRRTTGSVTTVEPIQVFSAEQAREYFGDGSPAALMVEAAMEQSPYLAEVWVVALGEPGGAAAAAGTIAFSASGLEAGALTIYIGRHAITVGVGATDTASTVAALVTGAVNDDPSLPFTASASTGTVTLTCRTKGTNGNRWVLATDYTGAGLTATVTQPTSGATDADIQDALDAVYATQFDVVASEWSDTTNLDALVTHLDDVSGPMEQRPGVGVAGYVGTVSNASTLGSGRNSGRLSIGYLRGTRTHPYELAAAYAAMIAEAEDLAKPLNNKVLEVGVAPDALTDRLSRTEQESLLYNGIAPFEVGVSDSVRLVRSVTTYVSDDFGGADDTLLDLQTIRVLDYVRYAVRTVVTRELAGAKIADVALGPNTTDPAKIRALVLGTLKQLEKDLGYLERVDDHADRLVVERDSLVATRVNMDIPADIVDGLHVLAANFNLILG